MKLSLKTIVCLTWGLFSLASIPVQAADLKAGEQKAAQCASCHGAKGVSSNGQFPNLAGQQENYLEAQLKAFKDVSRANSSMKSVAAGLSEADIENLAAFFASLPVKPVATAKADATAKDKFAMCAGCHGSAGEGRGAVPRLASQHAQYIASQLHAFKNGSRKGAMSGVAAGLSDEDIKILSTYLSTLK